MELSPKEYGLSARIKLEQLSESHIGIVKQVKSRIIQKDALKIVDMADAIKQKEPKNTVSLICYNNICSKSVRLLKEHDIDVIFSE